MFPALQEITDTKDQVVSQSHIASKWWTKGLNHGLLTCPLNVFKILLPDSSCLAGKIEWVFSSCSRWPIGHLRQGLLLAPFWLLQKPLMNQGSFYPAGLSLCSPATLCEHSIGKDLWMVYTPINLHGFVLVCGFGLFFSGCKCLIPTSSMTLGKSLQLQAGGLIWKVKMSQVHLTKKCMKETPIYRYAWCSHRVSFVVWICSPQGSCETEIQRFPSMEVIPDQPLPQMCCHICLVCLPDSREMAGSLLSG